MSIYDNEGVSDFCEIAEQIIKHLPWVSAKIKCSGVPDAVHCHDRNGKRFCTITPSVPFEVLVAGGGDHLYCSPLLDILARVRELAEAARAMQLGLVIKDCVGIPGTVEQAPAEPTLREFLVEFREAARKGAQYENDHEDDFGCPWSRIFDWLDARLGEEESDG